MCVCVFECVGTPKLPKPSSVLPFRSPEEGVVAKGVLVEASVMLKKATTDKGANDGKSPLLKKPFSLFRAMPFLEGLCLLSLGVGRNCRNLQGQHILDWTT